jgi:hypothetical protein
MSMPLQSTFACHQCGNEQSFTYWQSLNATLDPDAKAELLSGSLIRFACERCHWTCNVGYPMLYHDMKQGLLIQMMDVPSLPPFPAMPFGAGRAKYRRRWVKTPAELQEKIRIFDSGLDDRLVELFKAYVMSQSGWEDTAQLSFVELGDDPSTGKFILYHLVSTKYSGPLPLPRDGFDNFSAILASRLKLGTEVPDAWPQINKQYAEKERASFPTEKLALLPKAN